MRLGVIARADDRGLGIQTWEVARNLAPAAVLLIDARKLSNAPAIDWHPERYPDATVAEWQPGFRLDEALVRAWLAQVDVVYSAETWYDDRLPGWADELGVATVLHVNPELYTGAPATVHWSATRWRLDHLPAGTVVMPMPASTDRATPETGGYQRHLRVLHVAGRIAIGDRNGTDLVFQAVRRLRRPVDMRITVQDGHVPMARTRQKVEVVRGNVTNWWDLYRDADVLVLPRRYGGLCLPIIEAAAAGLAIIAGEREAEVADWPARLARGGRGPVIRCKGGLVDTFVTDPAHLAQLVDELSYDAQVLADAKAASRAWAQQHSWAALAPTWQAELARAVALARAA